jgi:hypothetical protein
VIDCKSLAIRAVFTMIGELGAEIIGEILEDIPF